MQQIQSLKIMKFTILLAVISSIKYVRSESCQCAAYFTSDIAEVRKIYKVPDYEIENCYQTAECHRGCYDTFSRLTNNGDVTHIAPNGLRIAQLACHNYGYDIENGQLGAYIRVCNGPWQYINTANGPICCRNGDSVPC
ncbi:uncharacterized protein [Anabrus simplex]|uniref:uncharacterized protein n=1 Tax=Anabrus simplex TaxID=316456 RepID=UPI0035A29398